MGVPIDQHLGKEFEFSNKLKKVTYTVLVNIKSANYKDEKNIH